MENDTNELVARARAHLTVSELAYQLGVSRMTLYRWLAGTQVPRLDDYRALEALVSKLEGEPIAAA